MRPYCALIALLLRFIAPLLRPIRPQEAQGEGARASGEKAAHAGCAAGAAAAGRGSARRRRAPGPPGGHGRGRTGGVVRGGLSEGCGADGLRGVGRGQRAGSCPVGRMPNRAA